MRSFRPRPTWCEVSEVGDTTEEYVFVAAGETLDSGRAAGRVGGRHRIRVPVPFQGRREGRGRRDRVLQRNEEDRVHRPGVAKPHVVIPVFPGNNCEYDSAAAFERAGADVSTLIVNNLTPAAVAESTQRVGRRDQRRARSS